MLPQPLAQSDINKPPKLLPASIRAFLSDALCLSLRQIDHCWYVLRDDAWKSNAGRANDWDEEKRLFQEHGWKYGLSMCFIPFYLHKTDRFELCLQYILPIHTASIHSVTDSILYTVILGENDDDIARGSAGFKGSAGGSAVLQNKGCDQHVTESAGVRGVTSAWSFQL